MAVIIGAGTQIPEFAGVVSASWGIDPSVTRLWQLGSWSQYDSYKEARQNLSITTYGGDLANPVIYLQPSTSCANSTATKVINLYPASCDGIDPLLDDVNNPWFLESYSYAKEDVKGYGQESWNWFRYISLEGEITPDFIIQGISTGQYSGNVLDLGVLIPTVDAEGYSGSISAGQGSTGQHDRVYYGVVTRVGGGSGRDDGKRGRASAQIPHIPVYL